MWAFVAATMASAVFAACSLTDDMAAVATDVIADGAVAAPVEAAPGGSGPPASGRQGRQTAVERHVPARADDADATADGDLPAGRPPSASLVLARSAPVSLRVAAIGVDTDLLELGLEADGSMEVPPGAFPAGWYTGAPTPGELGPAIIVGHVDWAGEPGVFAGLGDLHAGDEIAVTRQDGATAVFEVTEVQRVAKRDFPTATVYGDLDHAGLRLITCGGAFDRTAGSYEDNVIAFATLRGTSGP